MFGSRNFLFARSAAGYIFRAIPSGTLFSWGTNPFGMRMQGTVGVYPPGQSSPVQVGALTNWALPSAGPNHSMCTKSDGTLWGAGYNGNGQLGLGNTTILYTSPKQVGSLKTWKAPAAGETFMICPRQDGSLWSWGYNNNGQLGQGDTINRSSPVQIGSLTTWKKPSASSAGYVVLCTRENGTLWAWGRNNNGQLGLGDTVNRSSPTQIGALTNWLNPIAAKDFSLCVKTDGTLWSWGRGNYGALGVGDTYSRSSPVQIGNLTNWVSPANFGSVSAGCVKNDRTLWTWGYNGGGQLGLGNTASRSSPVQVGALTNWGYPGATGRGSSFCTQPTPTLAPTNLVIPTVTGTAQEGQTLTSTTGMWENLPTSFAYQWQRGTSNISGATSSTYEVVAADVGSTLRCVVTAINGIGSTPANSANTATVIAYVGKLFSWGRNNYGNLAQNNTTDLSSPVQVGSETQWAKKSISRHALAVKTNGQLWSWGYGASGQLGHNNTTYYSSPKQVGALTDWATPGISSNSSLCVKTDGTLWTWGVNGSGQLGLGDTVVRSSPVQVGALTNWKTPLIGSETNSFMLCSKTDGTLWAWGRGGGGVLGLGDTTNRSSPVQVGTLTNWSTPVAGNNFTVCSKTDGTLWAWGNGVYGKLGLGNTNYYSSPVQIGALTNWSIPIAGNNFAACIKTDGTLWAWGVGANGQLGQSNTTNYSSPKQVGALTNWKTPAAGVGNIVCAKTDGTLWAWGRNDQGNLGLGDTTQRDSPVQVGSLTTWLVPSVTNRSVICTQQ